MDTEGLNSPDRNNDVDYKIFSLSILLSSTFIYNQIGHITEESLENLSVVLHLTSSLKIRENNEEETGVEFKKFFPSFIWVMRDFSLNFQHLTPDAYLDQILDEQKGLSDDVFHKNSIRRTIRSFFKDIDCVPLVRPVHNENELKNIDNLKYEDLRIEFRESLDKLMNKLKSNPMIKTINNKPLTGSMLLGIVLEYVDALNK